MPKTVPDLRIAKGFTLPPQAVTQTFAIMARRGAGKTTTSGVMVEEMVKAGLPTCVVDPIGVWFGLRSSADGRSPGLPVVILGGEHGDAPLLPTAGATHIHAMVAVDPSAHRSIVHDAPRPHGVLHVVSEVATWGAAALLHGSVAATARVARLFGVKVP